MTTRHGALADLGSRRTRSSSEARSVKRHLVLAAACSLWMLGTACSPDPNSETGATDGGTEASAAPNGDLLATATSVELRNARMPFDDVVTGGQPSSEQMEALVAGGVRHAISLRPASEDGAGWEEVHAAEFGYEFDRLPITGAESLTRENVEIFAAMLAEAEGEGTLLYCASSNRVGALVALKAAWLDGVPPEEALQLGLAAGLTRLEAPVRELLGISP